MATQKILRIIYIYLFLYSRYNCVAFDSDCESGLVVDFDAMSSSPIERHYITIYELQSVSTSAVSTHPRNFAKMILDTQYKYAMRTTQIAGCKFLRIGDLVEIRRLSEDGKPQQGRFYPNGKNLRSFEEGCFPAPYMKHVPGPLIILLVLLGKLYAEAPVMALLSIIASISDMAHRHSLTPDIVDDDEFVAACVYYVEFPLEINDEFYKVCITKCPPLYESSQEDRK